MSYIINIREYPQAFHKAHYHIVSRFKYGRTKTTQLVKSWQEEFDVKVMQDHSQYAFWERLEFRDETHFILWLLKWS